MDDNTTFANTIAQLVASPQVDRDGLCFAASMQGLLRSIDGGKSWADAYQSLNLVAGLPTLAVALSPAFEHDQTVFAGVSGGVLHSSDAGQTWGVTELPTPPPLVIALGLSPAFERDGTILAGTMEDGVFCSRDRGHHWEAWNFGLLDLNVLALAVSPAFATDETVYIAVESGIFRSSNGGRAWREVAFAVDDAPVLSLALSPTFAQDQTLFAGTATNGLFKSMDGGQTWLRMAPDFVTGSVDAIGLSPHYPARLHLWLLTNGELLVSEDDGQSWEPWSGSAQIDQADYRCLGSGWPGRWTRRAGRFGGWRCSTMERSSLRDLVGAHRTSGGSIVNPPSRTGTAVQRYLCQPLDHL